MTPSVATSCATTHAPFVARQGLPGAGAARPRIRATAVAAMLAVMPSPILQADYILPAVDAGFVTDVGGSAKGDGTLVPTAKFNYSVGFEVHYSTGALGAPLAPTLRKNYFVFDLTSVLPAETITSATLKLWTGTYESVNAAETYEIKASTDPGFVLSLVGALASGSSPADFDETTDPLVLDAATLYGGLADSSFILASASIDDSMDDSFIELTFTGDGLTYLNFLKGGFVPLGGMVSTVDLGDGTPQQPFGFTGPDIPGGDPTTPLLTLATIPEPGSALVMLLALALASRLASGRATPGGATARTRPRP